MACVVIGVDERLAAWEQRTVVLLSEWAAAVVERDAAKAKLDAARAFRERDLERITGMTAKDRTWVQRHLTYATRPRDMRGRETVVRWLYRRARVEKAEATKWRPRITAAETRLRAAALRLADVAGEVRDAWPSRLADELTGTTSSQRAWLIRRGPA
jgi:hypothetical protein